MRRGGGGFTLIDVMIALAILGLLAAIALPNYSRYRLKATRVHGENCLREIAKREDVYFSANGSNGGPNNTYASGLSSLGINTTSCGDVVNHGEPYVVGIAAATVSCPVATCFCVTATPQGSQLNDGVLALTIDSTQTDPDSREVRQRFPVNSGGSGGTVCGVAAAGVDSVSSWVEPSANGY